MKNLINKGDGEIFFFGRKKIQIKYKDPKVFEKVMTKLEEFIDEINIINIPKKEVESGFHLSKMYQNKLKK